MSHRGRLTDVALAHRSRRVEGLLVAESPHGSHRDVSLALHRHTVNEVEPTVLVGFEVGLQSVVMSDACRILVHTLANQFADGRTPVVEKLLAALAALHNLSCQHRQPGPQTVASALLKLSGQLRSPCFPACLVAVDEQVVEFGEIVAQSFLIRVEIVGEEAREGSLVHLCHLQSGGIGRSRVVLLSR